MTVVEAKEAFATRGFLNGLIWTTSRVVDAILDALFDWLWGVETAKPMNLEPLAISSHNKTSGRPYMPTATRNFRAFLRSVPLPRPCLGFLDYGCGKGRVLMQAADAGFKRVVGVELSPELCDIARMNLARFKDLRRNLPEVEIVQGDAALYDPPDDMGVE